VVNLFYHEIETSFFIRVEVGAGKVGWVRLESANWGGGWVRVEFATLGDGWIAGGGGR
jgi:hypothetical protein